MFRLMRTVEEYRNNARQCREMATHAKPEHRRILQEMAATWERLADERERQEGASPR